MNKWIVILIILPLFTKGQNNLVPNPSFEDTTQCPTNPAQLYVCVDWINPTACSPDYYHSCNPPYFSPPNTYFPNVGVPENGVGFQPAHTGDAYAALFAFSLAEPDHNLREYIQIELTDTLTQGTKYIVGFYASLADKFWYSVNTLGAYLSVDSISRTDMLRFEVIPQILNDSTNPLTSKDEWMLVTDTFVSATGGERFITIGNFNDDAESDTMLLTTGIENYYHAYYFIDDVSVIAIDSPVGLNEIENVKFSVYPNPTSAEMKIEYYSPDKNQSVIFEMYNIFGRLVKLQSISQSKTAISTEELQSGIYHYGLRIDGGIKYTGKEIIIK
jgi:hypothetical protein